MKKPDFKNIKNNLKNLKPVKDAIKQFQALTSGSEKPVIGVDIGSYSVKIVQLLSAGNNISVKSHTYKPYNFSQNAPASEKKVNVTEIIKDLVKKLDIVGKPCAVSVGGNSVIVRYVAISQTNKKDIKKTLKKEAEPFLPFDVNDVNLDCYILGDTKQGKQTKTEIVLIASKKDVIQSKLELLNSAKLQPVIVDVDAFAIENLCQNMKIDTDEGGVLILNIGHKLTNLTVIEKGLTRVVRDIVISGSSFTKAISKACEVEYEKAEVLKHGFGIAYEGDVIDTPQTQKDPEPEKPENPEDKKKEEKETPSAPKTEILPEDEKYRAQVSETLKENIKDLSAEIKRSIDFYYSQGKDRSLSRVYLTGGSAAMKNIDTALKEQLNMPVEILDSFGFLENKDSLNIEEKIIPSMSVSAGLALRKIWDWT